MNCSVYVQLGVQSNMVNMVYMLQSMLENLLQCDVFKF